MTFSFKYNMLSGFAMSLNQRGQPGLLFPQEFFKQTVNSAVLNYAHAVIPKKNRF